MGDGVSIRFCILDTSSVGPSVCLELGTAVRADQPKVLWVVVLRISVDVIEDKFDRGGFPRQFLRVQRARGHIAAFRNTALRTPRQIVTLDGTATRLAFEIVGQHVRLKSLAHVVSHWRVRLTTGASAVAANSIVG